MIIRLLMGHCQLFNFQLLRMSDTDLTRSTSRTACARDDAAFQGFFGWLETALFYPRDCNSTTIEQLIEAVDSYYICWYGEKRIQMSRDSLNLVGQRAKLGLTA
jgi:hypothetical protein